MKHIFLYCSAFFILVSCTPHSDHLTILHTNDTHSQVQPKRGTNLGGYARRMGLIAQERKADKNLLLLDAGDFCQGTPYFNFYNGRVEIEAMNRMGYDAATLGNHEFDKGLDSLAMLIRMADFPFVCANYDFTGTPLDGLVKPYIILNKGGLKVGIFGLGCQPRGMISTANFGNCTYHDPYPVAQAMADTLRALKCDVVICLSHVGTAEKTPGAASDSAMVRLTKGIDLVIGGHTHVPHVNYRVPNCNGDSVPLCQMAKSGTFLGKIMLYLGDKIEK